MLFTRLQVCLIDFAAFEYQRIEYQKRSWAQMPDISSYAARGLDVIGFGTKPGFMPRRAYSRPLSRTGAYLPIFSGSMICRRIAYK